MSTAVQAKASAEPVSLEAALASQSDAKVTNVRRDSVALAREQERWQDKRVVLFSGQYFTLKDQPEARYDSISIAEIVDLVRTPAAAEKEQAPATIGSTYCEYDARSHDVQRAHGQYALLRFDIDSGNPPLEDVAQAFTYVLPGCGYLIYSTSSATPTNKRWRVLVPLLQPVSHEV
ncbi:MAG: hypothetical protein RL014_1892 [Pseudomonadota bacterium]